MDVCEHGTLRRKCEVCHLNGEVAELEAKLAAAEKRNGELEKRDKEYDDELDRILHRYEDKVCPAVKGAAEQRTAEAIADVMDNHGCFHCGYCELLNTFPSKLRDGTWKPKEK